MEKAKYMIKEERGQSVAEFALVLPIFLLILMGIIEFGLLMSDYVVVVNAAREGGRIAALGGTDQDVLQKVRDVAPSLRSSALTVTTTPDEYNRRSGEEVSVVVEYQAVQILPVFENIIPEIYNVKGDITMRVE
ncbi:MAG TPA: pilus assembly protein TadG [Clostridiales bacterium]|nr:MAG: hypothetical protein A2Y18_00250 [Clostridiales bacterium GWD2_32_19]HCC06939.1 pilus assembly protein TadG [Clostridiales bacterium]